MSEIEKWDARKVLQAIHYDNFCSEYEEAYVELNSNEDS